MKSHMKVQYRHVFHRYRVFKGLLAALFLIIAITTDPRSIAQLAALFGLLCLFWDYVRYLLHKDHDTEITTYWEE